MTIDQSIYGSLARLLDYPAAGYCEAAEEWIAQIGNQCPVAGEALQPFLAFVRERSAEKLEELYCITFDNSQTAALELGWHVYGETYERGAFLVQMRALLREHGVPERSELPDHLSLVLQAMSLCSEEHALKLAADTVKPAVRKILVSLAADQNPYEPVLDAVLQVTRQHAQQSYNHS
ncbi:MAG: nitrate reductase molybdenum cofactor assembly chaperone [Planctomycetes bacterium]|nr:nitrate reductase molybdenum cofactor assembly chaperone [Planctomycetota bacterium]NQU48185.1 nitrate reductase molybdenum cofactor assembly chaperone [Planctomycetota bacterium]